MYTVQLCQSISLHWQKVLVFLNVPFFQSVLIIVTRPIVPKLRKLFDFEKEFLSNNENLLVNMLLFLVIIP